MLSPVEVLAKVTTDEFIRLTQLVGSRDYEVLDIERDENLDLTVFVQLPDKECKAVKVRGVWPISA